MSERGKCMFDTNIFNRLVEHNVPIEVLTECGDVQVTHVQWDELCKTPCQEKRNRLTRVFRRLEPEKRPTETAVWGVSKWGEAKWSADDQWQQMKAELDRLKKRKNNSQDALIAETAIKNGFTLFTEDVNLRKVAARFGATCMSFEDLQQHCREPRPAVP